MSSDAPARASSDAAVHRRTLIKAGAWSVPVIALSSATPAFAASTTTPCKAGPVVVARGAWSITSGALRTDQTASFTGWDGSGFTSVRDNASTTNDLDVVATYSFSAIRGATYRVGFDVRMGYSNPQGSSERQNLVVNAVQGSSVTKLASATLKHSGISSTRKSDSAMKSLGYTVIATAGTSQSFSGTIVAGATGTVTIQYALTLVQLTRSLLTKWGNDDVWLTAPTVTLLTCPA